MEMDQNDTREYSVFFNLISSYWKYIQIIQHCQMEFLQKKSSHHFRIKLKQLLCVYPNRQKFQDGNYKIQISRDGQTKTLAFVSKDKGFNIASSRVDFSTVSEELVLAFKTSEKSYYQISLMNENKNQQIEMGKITLWLQSFVNVFYRTGQTNHELMRYLSAQFVLKFKLSLQNSECELKKMSLKQIIPKNEQSTEKITDETQQATQKNQQINQKIIANKIEQNQQQECDDSRKQSIQDILSISNSVIKYEQFCQELQNFEVCDLEQEVQIPCSALQFRKTFSLSFNAEGQPINEYYILKTPCKSTLKASFFTKSSKWHGIVSYFYLIPLTVLLYLILSI